MKAISSKRFELSRQHHDEDLKEKHRLSRLLDNKNIFLERVLMNRWVHEEAESRRKEEPERKAKMD